MSHILIKPRTLKRIVNSVLIGSVSLLLPFSNWRAIYPMPGWGLWLVMIVIFLSGYLYRSVFAQYEKVYKDE